MTTRLIDSGLRSNGYRVFSKTRGTTPIYINCDNEEVKIRRSGRANINEQIKIMKKAYKDRAEIVVIECMAVDPELQYISQHKMVRSNIGVITNVRLDHIDVMGKNLEEICDSLSNTIPKNGYLFTSDLNYFKELKENGLKLSTKTFLCTPNKDVENFKFPENYSIAIEVCKFIGCDYVKLLKGMKSYKPDPYDLSIIKLKSGGLFINGLSINDISSIKIVFNLIKYQYDLEEKKFILLINNRSDRGYRTKQMIEFANKVNPDSIYICGSHKSFVAKNLLCPRIYKVNSSNSLPLDIDNNSFIFAIGNIGNKGDVIVKHVKERGI